ncbi:hypothetical protein Tco_0782280 [Tanacetum coccineum]
MFTLVLILLVKLAVSLFPGLLLPRLLLAMCFPVFKLALLQSVYTVGYAAACDVLIYKKFLRQALVAAAAVFMSIAGLLYAQRDYVFPPKCGGFASELIRSGCFLTTSSVLVNLDVLLLF